jgi:hypothetical protein
MPVGLLVRLWSPAERLQVQNYEDILLFLVNGYDFPSEEG